MKANYGYHAQRSIKNKNTPANYLLFLLIFCTAGCKKFVQVNPPQTEISGATVYSDNTSSASELTSIYDNMIAQGGLSSGENSISILSGLSADELENYSSTPSFQQFYTNSLVAAKFSFFWTEIYNEIYVANSALEGIASSNSISPDIKSQLTGEALFMRSFLLFYGINLFGDVPLVTTTNYLVNSMIKRSPATQVYNQIIMDLKQAQGLLTNNYLTPAGLITPLRVRPNKGTVEALLARVYLYTGDWPDAELLADSVIANPNYSLDSNLNNVFLSTSTEAIWQFQSIYPGANTWDAYFLVLTSAPGTGNYFCALDTNLINAFEPNDQRYANWVASYSSGAQTFYYPYKYKIGTIDPSVTATEYTTAFRLAEQYLIRAEARAMQGSNLQGAIADLNVIRGRAGLAPLSQNLSEQAILAAVARERRVELFTEWGHRWLDLKRTEAIDSVMSIVTPEKGGTWSPNWSLYPIPQSEILLNRNLTQNAGY